MTHDRTAEPPSASAETHGSPPSPQQALSEPIERRALRVLLGRLALVLPPPELPPGHAALAIEDYLEALAGYPRHVVEAALRQGRKRWKFHPRIAEIVEEIEAVIRKQPRPEPPPAIPRRYDSPPSEATLREAPRLLQEVQDPRLRGALERVQQALQERADRTRAAG